jgi:hypothetical protein
VNTEWQNLTINASRLILIGQLYSLYDCAYFQGGGIGNTVIINNTRFLGSNKLGYNRLMTITQPQNITFANNMFDDFLWENRVFGLISGYTASTSCALESFVRIRILNNTFYNSPGSPAGSIPIQILNEFSHSSP